MATFLDSVCFPFDHAVLEAIHRFAEATGGIFNTPVALFSLLSAHGIGMILLGLLLALFPRTRKAGACVLFGVAVGALITNVAVKNLVARPRPYADAARDIFAWWQYAGSHIESEFSFPSGHATATTAAMTAIFLSVKKKRCAAPLFLVALLMGFSRMYLVVHYPTDVLAGFLSGAIGAVLAYWIVRALWNFFTARAERGFCRFVLTFDPVGGLYRRIFKKKERNA